IIFPGNLMQFKNPAFILSAFGIILLSVLYYALLFSHCMGFSTGSKETIPGIRNGPCLASKP
ncbi:MAG: hypothetical protein U9P14_10630, partial [Gemmatimonadota bacterium]|nr:hypothetical protein [Gemmatimonadota bacterium]